MKRVANTL